MTLKLNINFLIFLLITICVLLAEKVCADGFHVWIDDAGRRHVSTIPHRGFSADGSLRRAYNPNSLVAQHYAMRKSLSEQSAQIAHQQAERERLDEQLQATGSQRTIRTPKEGIMGLSDLIELERRGGRYSEKP